ncbi:MAG: hypothetical protein HQK55_00905 [Deltaproteobacteria bacterium]|nr:hypothetical protein [Deltaproteobacteria bacterium]
MVFQREIKISKLKLSIMTMIIIILSFLIGCIPAVDRDKNSNVSYNGTLITGSEEQNGPSKQIVSFISKMSIGSSAFFKSTNFGNEIKVTIGSDYISALGKKCRFATISSVSGDEPISICLIDGNWECSPRIWQTTLSENRK